jgi:hypothetical protein
MVVRQGYNWLADGGWKPSGILAPNALHTGTEKIGQIFQQQAHKLNNINNNNSTKGEEHKATYVHSYVGENQRRARKNTNLQIQRQHFYSFHFLPEISAITFGSANSQRDVECFSVKVGSREIEKKYKQINNKHHAAVLFSISPHDETNITN